MKKVIIITVLFIFILGISGCSLNVGNLSKEEAPVRQAVIDAVEAVKEYDTEKMAEFFSDDKSEFEGITEEYNEFMKKVCGKLTYKINSAKKMDDTLYTVKLSVSTVDIPDIIERSISYFKEHSEKFLNTPQEEVVNVLFRKCIEIAEKEDIKYISKDIEVTVKKVDSKWIPEFLEEEKNILFGNLDKVAALL